MRQTRPGGAAHLGMAIAGEVHGVPIGHMSPVTAAGFLLATKLCKGLGMFVVAEGIEKPEERDAAMALGCDLLQGYLFAKPGPPFPEVAW